MSRPIKLVAVVPDLHLSEIHLFLIANRLNFIGGKADIFSELPRIDHRELCKIRQGGRCAVFFNRQNASQIGAADASCQTSVLEKTAQKINVFFLNGNILPGFTENYVPFIYNHIKSIAFGIIDSTDHVRNRADAGSIHFWKFTLQIVQNLGLHEIQHFVHIIDIHHESSHVPIKNIALIQVFVKWRRNQ